MEHMSYAKGISWIDDCRIPFVDEKDKGNFNNNSDGINRQKSSNTMETYMNNKSIVGSHNINDTRQQGRFPANLLVCDNMLNDGIITKQNPRKYNNKGDNKIFVGAGKGVNYANGDSGSSSRYYNIDKWFENLLESCG
jgi:hypothetical protein